MSDVLPPVKQECTLAEVKQEAATDRGAGEDFPEEHTVFTEPPASPTKAEPGDKLGDIGRSGYNTKAWSYVDNLVPTPCVKCLNATSPKGLYGECSSLLSEKDTLIKEVMMPDEGDQPEPPTNKVTPATSQESIPDLVGSDSTSQGEDILPKLPKFQLKLEDLDLQMGYHIGLTSHGSPTAEKANVKWEFPELNKEDRASTGAPEKDEAPWQLVAKKNRQGQKDQH